MYQEELLRAVPVYTHRGQRYFVRIGEIPEPWRSQFIKSLRGAGCPVLTGEGPLAFAWDWETWVQEGAGLGGTASVQ